MLVSGVKKTAVDLFRTSNLTERWMKREITNFDYLMQLNTIAGESSIVVPSVLTSCRPVVQRRTPIPDFPVGAC